MKRIAAWLLVLGLFAFGCSAQQEQTGTVREPETSAETLTGTVKAIDEKGLSLSIMPELPAEQMPGTPGGDPPEMPQGERPESDPAEKPDGQMP